MKNLLNTAASLNADRAPLAAAAPVVNCSFFIVNWFTPPHEFSEHQSVITTYTLKALLYKGCSVPDIVYHPAFPVRTTAVSFRLSGTCIYNSTLPPIAPARAMNGTACTAGTRTSSSRHWTSSPKHRTSSPKHWMSSPKHWTSSPECWTSSPERWTSSPGYWASPRHFSIL